MSRFLYVASLCLMIITTGCEVSKSKKSESCTFNGLPVDCNKLSGGGSTEADKKNKEECISVAENILSNSTQVDRVCRNATRYSADCLSEANTMLFSDQIVEVCEYARSTSESCLRSGKNIYSREELVRKCK